MRHARMAWGALLVAAIALGWMADESWARGRRCRGRVAVQEAEVQVEACQAPAPVKAAEPAKVPAKTKTAPQPKAAERPKVSEKPYLSETPAEKPKVVEKPKADDMPRTVEKPKAVEKPKVSEKPAETKAPDKSKGVPATAIPVPRTDAGWVQRQAQINARVKQGNVDLIFIGDSITQGWEGAKDIWQQFYGKRNAANLGIGGDQTQHVLWRLDHGNITAINPELAVIMIGTNNTHGFKPEEIALGVKAIVEKLRKDLPDTKVLVLAIFPRGANKDDRLRQVVAKTNELLSKIGDGKAVRYLDIGPKFLEKDGTLSKEIMPDFLHLTAKGYRIWAESIEPAVAEVMGPK